MKFQPADKIVLGYFAIMAVVEIAWYPQIPQANWLLALHAIGAALIVLAARVENPSKAVSIFRHWYPILFVGCCYREMAILIPDIRHARFDRFLADLDFSLWGANPTVWVERFYNPVFTEFLQVVYTLFVPVALLPALVVWLRGDFASFRKFAFLLSLGFLVSYVGYIAVPARGPRYLLANLQHLPLQGLWLFNGMQTLLDRIESSHYDCFPSGHTEITILAWSLARRVSPAMFRFYGVYTILIVFSTIYLRYHYTMDLAAGALTALALIWLAPRLYRGLSEE